MIEWKACADGREVRVHASDYDSAIAKAAQGLQVSNTRVDVLGLRCDVCRAWVTGVYTVFRDGYEWHVCRPCTSSM